MSAPRPKGGELDYRPDIDGLRAVAVLKRAPRRTRSGLDPAAAEMDSLLRALFGERSDVKYFSAMDAMCDKDGCLTRTGDSAESLTSWDYGHLTTPGAEFVSRAMANASNGFR